MDPSPNAPPAVTSTFRATTWHPPGRRKGGPKRRGRQFWAERSLARRRPREPHPRPVRGYDVRPRPQTRPRGEARTILRVPIETIIRW